MKTKKLIAITKVALAIVVLLPFAGIQASEVTGSLSSSGVLSETSQNSEGQISGSVSGGGTSGGGSSGGGSIFTGGSTSGGSQGSVAIVTPDLTVSPGFTSAGNRPVLVAVNSGSQPITIEAATIDTTDENIGTTEEPEVQTNQDQLAQANFDQLATTAAADTGLAWYWWLLLIILLLAAFGYTYRLYARDQ